DWTAAPPRGMVPPTARPAPVATAPQSEPLVTPLPPPPAQKPPPPAPPAAPPRPRAAARPGYLNVYAEPWAYVLVDGKRVGTTPLLRLPVPAGTHRVRLE